MTSTGHATISYTETETARRKKNKRGSASLIWKKKVKKGPVMDD